MPDETTPPTKESGPSIPTTSPPTTTPSLTIEQRIERIEQALIQGAEMAKAEAAAMPDGQLRGNQVAGSPQPGITPELISLLGQLLQDEKPANPDAMTMFATMGMKWTEIAMRQAIKAMNKATV